MSILVLPDGFMLPQTAVPGTILTVNAAPLLRRQVVRPIIRLPVIRHAAHLERIPADIPVIAAVMIPARPELLKITPDHTQQQPNAVPDVTDVNLVRPVPVLLIPDLMPERPNVTADKAVINVMIPVEREKNRFLVPRLIKR